MTSKSVQRFLDKRTERGKRSDMCWDDHLMDAAHSLLHPMRLPSRLRRRSLTTAVTARFVYVLAGFTRAIIGCGVGEIPERTRWYVFL